MKWQDYKQKKLEDPKFKQEYDKLESEYSAMNEKLFAESNKKIPAKSHYTKQEKFFEQVAIL